MYTLCHNTKNFEQIHWNQLFCGMCGLAVMLSIPRLTTSKNIDEMLFRNIFHQTISLVCWFLNRIVFFLFYVYQPPFRWHFNRCWQIQMKQPRYFEVKIISRSLRNPTLHSVGFQNFLKFIYSEKATKFCKISTLLLSYVVPVKSKVEISQNSVAFSEFYEL